jgi:choline monooxygenase
VDREREAVTVTSVAFVDEGLRAVREQVETGVGLPADWYTDPSIFQLEQERIFRKTWQLVGHATQVERAGDFFTCRVGGVPLIVARGSDGTLRAFENVCRHRGSEIVQGAGNRSSFQCRFHGWTYGLDGCLKGVPRAGDVAGFDAAEYPLFAAHVEEWGPFIFANSDPDAEPLARWLGPLPQIVDEVGLDLFAASNPPIRREWELNANWKAVVENFCECYHCQINHPGFAKVLNLEPRELIIRDYDELSLLLLKNEEFEADGSNSDSGQPVPSFNMHGALFDALVWPNFVFNTYPGPGNVTTQVIVPLDVDRTLMIYEYFLFDGVGEQEANEFVEFWDRVQDEDTPLVEAIQRGAQSPRFRGGPLFPADGLVRRFDTYVCRALTE